MKKIKPNLWTDGTQEYTGNPKDGFKPVVAEKPKAVVEASAFELKQPKKEVDTEDKE